MFFHETTRDIQYGLAIACLLLLATDAVGGESFVEVDGAQLHCYEAGEGPVVVLVHGYTGSWQESWKKTGLLDSLVANGYRVLAMDQRGHGRSTKPRQQDSYGIQMVKDLERLLDHFNIDRAHLVGYSMGSVIVNKFRDLYPARILSVTLGGYGWPPLPDRYSQELEDEVAANLKKMKLDAGNDARALSLISVGWHEWKVGLDRLRSNRVPALVIVGRDDPFRPDSQKLAEQMETTRFVEVSGDHGAVLVEAAFMRHVIEFVTAIESER